MDSHFLFPLTLFGVPLLGLALGALLPPFLYGKNAAIAVVLNVAGFLLYILPALFISLLICADNFKSTTEGETIAALCLAPGVFAVVEGITFLLRRVFHKNTVATQA